MRDDMKAVPVNSGAPPVAAVDQLWPTAVPIPYSSGRRVAGFRLRAVLVAAIAAVLGGLSGIALGSWLAWRTVDPLAPDKATAAGMAVTVLPGAFGHKVEYYERPTFWNPYSNHSLHGGTGVRVGTAQVDGIMPPNAGSEQIAAAVEDQMRAQGWHDVRTTVDRHWSDTPSKTEVSGTRAGYLAAVQIIPDQEPALSFILMWAEPPGQLRDTIAGGVAGMLLGALLGFSTSQRMRRYDRGRQTAYSILCLTTLVMLAPACLANIPTSTGSLTAATHRQGAGPSVYWGGFVLFGAEPLAILSLLPILAILTLCVWPRTATNRRHRPTEPWSQRAAEDIYG
ncbi:hypothetical protein ACWT_3235 [Actinoplanes sp. SE50]|uniref:hypothetical protein n=1 Tax=unclassified Actinoplanes TaxID=2626549 RepID=UPI00023EC972|nr:MULTISPECIES: hypothetical protein [unclassified Actinoplanes]AEV84258.1 hypothetical protein ACPL_3363 [Actinoplanes sp. SE50/110]ATO82650.1 hypothetical protein ACWT_3235 [Actinoplanes sp. SE50]SLM00057.1 hypothetical protein ACSP50_3289 [Actinoplanes sp. SE50/110]